MNDNANPRIVASARSGPYRLAPIFRVSIRAHLQGAIRSHFLVVNGQHSNAATDSAECERPRSLLGTGTPLEAFVAMGGAGHHSVRFKGGSFRVLFVPRVRWRSALTTYLFSV